MSNPLEELNNLVRTQQEMHAHFEHLAELAEQNARFMRNGEAWTAMKREAKICAQRALVCKTSAEILKEVRREYLSKT